MNTDTLFDMNDLPRIIRNLQTMLRYISRYVPEIPAINIDGIFGEETENAVRAFQLYKGLPPTGVVDLTTWEEIVKEYIKLQNAHTIPGPVYVFPPEIQALTLGDDFDEIIILQVILKKLADRYENVPRLDISGIYDEKTRETVMALQKAFQLPQTGVVDRPTWSRLISLYSTLTFHD